MANKLGMLIIVGIIGAAASFFTSPRSGFENRNLAKDAVNAILGGSAVGGNQVVAQATQAAESAAAAGQEILKNAAEKGQEFYATASVKVREVAQNGIPGVAAQNAENDELRQKIEAARARIAAQVVKNAEEAQLVDAEPVEEPVEAEVIEEEKPEAE